MQRISSDVRYGMEMECDDLLNDTLEAWRDFDGEIRHLPNFFPLLRRGPLAVYRSLSPTDGTNALPIRLSGYLKGSLEDVTTGLYYDTDEDAIAAQQLLSTSRCSILDAKVLEATETASADAPFRFAGTKYVTWMQMCATDASVSTHTMLTYERMGRSLDSDGCEVAYHAIVSMDEYPDLSFPNKLKHVYMCYLYKPITPTLVEVFMTGTYAANGSPNTQRVKDDAIANRALLPAKALQCCEARKLTSMVSTQRPVADPAVTSCASCNKKRVKDLMPCAICQDHVCSNCRQEKPLLCVLDNNLLDTRSFCRPCLSSARLPDTTPISQEEIHRHEDEAQRERHMSRERRTGGSYHAYNYHGFVREYSVKRRTFSTPLMPRAIERSKSLPVPSTSEDMDKDAECSLLERRRQRRKRNQSHQRSFTMDLYT